MVFYLLESLPVLFYEAIYLTVVNRPYITLSVGFVGTLSHSCRAKELIVLV